MPENAKLIWIIEVSKKLPSHWFSEFAGLIHFVRSACMAVRCCVYTSQSNIFVNDWWLCWLCWLWWQCIQCVCNILTTYLHTRMHCDWCWHCCYCCHSFTDILLCDDIHAVCMLITYWNHLAYTHEIIFARWFTFSCSPKSQSKIIPRLVVIWFHFDFLEKWKSFSLWKKIFLTVLTELIT